MLKSVAISNGTFVKFGVDGNVRLEQLEVFDPKFDVCVSVSTEPERPLPMDLCS